MRHSAEVTSFEPEERPPDPSDIELLTPQGVLVLNQEQIESLRLEASALGPEQQRHIDTLSKTIYATLLHHFGHYRPPHQGENSGEADYPPISSRILMMDQDMLNRFREGWFDLDEGFLDNRATAVIHGQYVRRGNLILIRQNTFNYYDNLNESSRNQLSTEGIDKDTFNTQEQECQLTETLAHEQAHSLQAKEDDEYFTEPGALFYGKNIADRLGLQPRICGPNEAGLTMIYVDLIKQYGEDVHRVFFGQPVELRRELDILASAYERVAAHNRLKAKAEQSAHPTLLEKLRTRLRRIRHASPA
jgi:hypothetical protein